MRLVVTGGGTGGHIYPALAIAKETLSLLPGAKVLYIGTSHGMESGIVPREGIPFQPVRSSGVMGKKARDALRGLTNASAGVLDAIRTLRAFRPDAVLGTGGYASGPVVMAAWLLRIPRAIQEQNAVPGKTNQVLSRLSQRVFAAWDYSVPYFRNRTKVLVTGNPVRKDLFGVKKEEGRLHFKITGDDPVILLLGGSRGAKTLTEAGLALARSGLPANLIFITGREYYTEVVNQLNAEPENGIEGARIGNIIIRPYVHEMALAYSAADLVIGRAGGMTLSEVTALGLPSVIVPSPNVAGNHQEYNARALEDKGAAIIIREKGNQDPAGDVCRAVSDLICDRSRLLDMSLASKAVGKPDATGNICRELVRLARGEG